MGLFSRTEGRFVVVDAHVAKVDRRDSVVEDKALIDLGERWRSVRDQEVAGQRSRRECGVHTEDDIGDRVPGGQDRLIDDGTGIAAREDLEDISGLLREGGRYRVGDGERVVGQQTHGRYRFGAVIAARAHQQSKRDEEHGHAFHAGPP